MANASKKSYIDMIQPDLTQAEKIGIPLDQIIGADLRSKEPTKTSTPKSQKAPNGDIINRNGKQYKWHPLAGKYRLI